LQQLISLSNLPRQRCSNAIHDLDGILLIYQPSTTKRNAATFENNFLELVELVEPAVIDLTVYGITGQKVATLARGWRAGGAHTLKWNGRDEAGRPMASGVYLYRLRAGVGVELTRRMLLLR